jgi:hypothetical protein
VWYLLAESSLVEFTSEIDRGDELKAGLFQKIQELDIPPQCVEKIDRTLKGFVREALVHLEQPELELPWRIRVFCQKKLIDGLTSAKISEPCHSGKYGAEMMHHPSTVMDGGWGYFLIERGGDVYADSSLSSYQLVDIYLYKEG